MQGECILMIGGYILTVDEESRLPGKSHDNGVQIAKDLVLCTVRPEEYGGVNYMNHSCQPNAGFNGQIAVVAMRDIAKDEEITIDYAMVLHKASKGPTYRLKCLCGAEACRGMVTESDWKSAALQEKYSGYFQPYLEAEIRKLRQRTRNAQGQRTAVPPAPTFRAKATG
ncbi:MAG: SET domain-containing protein-lysine N-methyltransferase [Sulfuritalea sp.]|nr:SET domain-containing protein-lysine N-methyltransferase [Sulfuritalea sp.]